MWHICQHLELRFMIVSLVNQLETLKANMSADQLIGIVT